MVRSLIVSPLPALAADAGWGRMADMISSHRLSETTQLAEVIALARYEKNLRYAECLPTPDSIRGLDLVAADRALQTSLRRGAAASSSLYRALFFRRFASMGSPGKRVSAHPHVSRGPDSSRWVSPINSPAGSRVRP